MQSIIKKINDSIDNEFDYLEIENDIIYIYSDGMLVAKFDVRHQELAVEENVNFSDHLMIFKAKVLLERFNLI